MTVSMREAFLADIIDSKADDAPRLIYADWLEENGEAERGEFIRVQCEIENAPLAGHNRDMSYKQFDSLRKRQVELLDKFEADWFPGLVACLATNNHVPVEEMPVLIRRGFAYSLRCTAADFFRHADVILKAQPIEEVTLTSPAVFSFSRVEMMEYPGRPGEARRVASWRAYLNGEQIDRVQMEIAYPIRERPRPVAFREFGERVEHERTAEAYLRMKFGKGIKFTLQEPEARVFDDYGPIQAEVWEQMTRNPLAGMR